MSSAPDGQPADVEVSTFSSKGNVIGKTGTSNIYLKVHASSKKTAEQQIENEDQEKIKKRLKP